jgi:hypothetical protein
LTDASPSPPFVHASAFNPNVDAGGVVTSDVACRKCAYNLRTLSISGRCPECGTSVGFSVQGDFLRFSDPNWVNTLRRGVICMLSGVGVIVLGVILATVIRSAEGIEWVEPFAAFSGLAGYLLYVIGSWLLTTPTPAAWARIATGLRESSSGSCC